MSISREMDVLARMAIRSLILRSPLSPGHLYQDLPGMACLIKLGQ